LQPLTACEQALRKLLSTYSLEVADAGVASAMVCEYVGVEEGSLAGIYRMAEAKLIASPHSNG
jgi:hypothetical protein